MNAQKISEKQFLFLDQRMKPTSLVSLLLFGYFQSVLSDEVSNESCNRDNLQKDLYEEHVPDESLNSLDQEDPILIEYVRKMIVPPSPSCVKYQFSR